MALAIFDLDNTLIGGDSDNLWGQFASRQGIVKGDEFARRNEQFYRDYCAGELDIDAYLRFALSPLVGQSPATLASWHRQFMASMIEPIMLPAARALVARHRAAGDDLLVITATNRYVTEPIVRALGISELLACEGEIIDGRYTGEPLGVPSYGQGKVTRLMHWLAERDTPMAGAWFYSDSHNDLPLLELVDNPVAVDPDPKLLVRAQAANWPVISLRT
jgi:HAD superfamily hydrolase (TIGR01490 family)